MLATLGIVCAAWFLLAAVGWLLLGVVRTEARHALLPASPVLGAMLLVVLFYDTSLLMSVTAALPVVGVVLLGLLVVAWRRDRSWWRPTRKGLLALLMVGVVSVLPASIVLAPSSAVGDSSLVQPSQNNDAFYYVAVADWLQSHDALQVPDIEGTPNEGGVPPSYGPAKATISHGIRIGQEMLHAAISSLFGLSTTDTWYPLTALWLLLIPAAGYAAGVLLRVGGGVGTTAGLLVSMSSITAFQLASQNSDSLLGIAFVLVAITAVADSLRDEPLLPRPVVGVLLTAWVGTYTELLPLVAPALVLLVVARSRRGWWTVVGRGAAVVGWALLLGPLPWIRAVSSLILIGGLANEPFTSAFMGVTPWLAASRFFGLTPIDGTQVSRLLPVVALVALIGLVGALMLSTMRWMWGGLLLMGVILAAFAVHQHRPYTQQRLVSLWLPFVFLIIVIGCFLVARHVLRRWPPSGRLRWGVGAPALALVLVFIVANLTSTNRLNMVSLSRSRHVDGAFAQAAGWIERYGGRAGEHTVVLSGDFFDQLWITDALRDEADVAYPSLFVSYQYQNSYWDGRPRRWLLVDSAVDVRAERGVIVRSNSRFRLLDLSRGRAVVLAPADEFGAGTVFVLRSPSAPRTIVLKGSTRPRTPTDSPLAPASLAPSVPGGALRAGQRRLDVTIPRGEVGIRIIPRNRDLIFDVGSVSFGGVRAPLAR